MMYEDTVTLEHVIFHTKVALTTGCLLYTSFGYMFEGALAFYFSVDLISLTQYLNFIYLFTTFFCQFPKRITGKFN